MKLPVADGHLTPEFAFSTEAQLWKAQKLENLTSVQSRESHYSGSGRLSGFLQLGRSVLR